MTDLDRRSFLKRSTAVTAGAAVAGGPMAGFLAAPAIAGKGRAEQPPLSDKPDLRDGQIRLALPDGFQYRSFQQSRRNPPPGAPQETLDDGSKLPGRHDGMAAFDGPGRRLVTLVRNHEENGSAVDGAFGLGTGAPVYDTSALGGNSVVRVSREGIVDSSFCGLGGTQMNCSGGRMPWGSWVTCEETVNGYDVADDFTRTPPGGPDPGPTTYVQNARLQKRHGFIFEVPSDDRASARPIEHAGRFAHEAVAWDPKGEALYLTEDNFSFPSGFYKYVPPKRGHGRGHGPRALRDGGRLFMAKVRGTGNADLARHQERGATYRIEWVEIEEPSFDAGRPAPGQPPAMTNDQAISFVGNQGREKGAALFSRLEGTTYDHGWIFFTSTQGGVEPGPTQPDTIGGFGKGFGQIWGYDTKRGTLHMLYESASREVLDFPDNVTTSPRGTLVVCEDGGDRNFLRGLTRKGRLFDIAQNRIATQPNDEFAGATFTPDGRTLFVNIQSTVGISLAIWGPWGRIDV